MIPRAQVTCVSIYIFTSKVQMSGLRSVMHNCTV